MEARRNALYGQRPVRDSCLAQMKVNSDVLLHTGVLLEDNEGAELQAVSFAHGSLRQS